MPIVQWQIYEFVGGGLGDLKPNPQWM